MTEKEYIEIKSKYFTTEDEKEEKDLLNKMIEYNKKLIDEFPFLLPINRWSGIVSDNYDYSYTELDSLPRGWRIAFGYDICKEIKDELIKEGYLNEYHITQIKEKYGTLRWYDNGHSDNIEKIINKYEDISENICFKCGEPAEYQHKRWVLYYCENCVNESEYPETFEKLNINKDE